MWTLWREQNSGTFEDAESSMTQLESLFNWYCAWGLKISNFLFRHQRITVFLCINFFFNSFTLLCVHYCVHEYSIA